MFVDNTECLPEVAVSIVFPTLQLGISCVSEGELFVFQKVNYLSFRRGTICVSEDESLVFLYVHYLFLEGEVFVFL